MSKPDQQLFSVFQFQRLPFLTQPYLELLSQKPSLFRFVDASKYPSKFVQDVCKCKYDKYSYFMATSLTEKLILTNLASVFHSILKCTS